MHAHQALREAAAAVRPCLEVSDIFRLHGQEYRNNHQLCPDQLKAMRAIENCRTASLGGHVDVCGNGCGFTRISYNSCRNRNCPKCQGLKSAQWLEHRLETILPTHYFHMVFTAPHEMLPLMLYNKQTLFNLLFRAAADSLLEFARDWERLRAHLGFTAILHTWNQDMGFHPHIHIVVTGGGLDKSETRWIPSRNSFLVPVRALSKKFQGKFIYLLKNRFAKGDLLVPEPKGNEPAAEAFRRLTNKLSRKKWVVYAKQPFGGPEQVFKYLGLYTHKVAISNHRLVHMTDGKVTFLARDNSDPGQKRSVTLTAQEFIRRFLLHILPRGFVKIRHYGLMAPRNTKTKLEAARRLIEPAQPQPLKLEQDEPLHTDQVPKSSAWQEIYLRITGIDLTKCPTCGGTLTRRPLTSLDQTFSTENYGPGFLDSS
jgi:hypothetical protein